MRWQARTSAPGDWMDESRRGDGAAATVLRLGALGRGDHPPQGPLPAWVAVSLPGLRWDGVMMGVVGLRTCLLFAVRFLCSRIVNGWRCDVDVGILR